MQCLHKHYRVATEEDEVNMLAEGTAAEISKQENPQGFGQSAGMAQRGGDVAHGARQLIEKELGHSVVSPLNANDYFNTLEQEDRLQFPDGQDSQADK